MAARSAILTFHSIDRSGSVISYDPELFRARMEALAASGPPVVPLGECLRSPGTIALTFDDGFANFATDAWPVLRRLGFAATLFVVSGRVGARNAWNNPGAGIPDLPLLDWADLEALAREGVELGAHSHTHADLTRVAAERLTEELERPAEMIAERTGKKPKAFAYPYGRVNGLVRAGAAAHYEIACGTDLGYWHADEDMHETPRLDAYYLRGDTKPGDVLSAKGMRKMAMRGLARRVRAGLGFRR